MHKIGIRADGNSKIGTGHIMRCLAIADSLRKLDNEVVFFTADANMKFIIQNQGFNVIVLDTEWTNLDGETDKICSELLKEKVEALLIDTYFVTEKYLKTIRKITKTAYIDDLFLFDYSVDLLINYSSYADINKYVVRKDTTYCIGTSFTPLREQFHKLKEIECNEKRILVLSGGTDPFSMASRLPQALLESEDLFEYEIVIVQGAFAKESETIKSNRVIYYKNIANMADLMQKTSIAVSAGGTTLYELCACRVPTVTYSFVDNQIENVQAFNRLGAMLYAGDLRDNTDNVIQKIVSFVEKLSNEGNEERKKIMSGLVDGNGTYRISSAIINLIQ